MSGEAICPVRVSPSAIFDAMTALSYAGTFGCEAIALWVGSRYEALWTVTGAYIPKQNCIRSNSGLAVHIEADELHRLNVWLYENQLDLIAQLHSHPSEAFHSDTDDAYPVATRLGAFSIVVPDFAAAPFDFGACAIYRLEQQGWARLSANNVAGIFSVGQ